MDPSEHNQEGQKREPKFSDSFYNRITYTGVVLSLLVFFAEVCLFLLDFFSHDGNIYLGMFTYLVLPGFLIFGLILIPIGAMWKRSRIRKGLAVSAPKVFFIDPSIPSHRNGLFVFIIGTSVLLIMTAIGSYKAFHYTESVAFCGLTCHKVMKPEYTAYTNSPHARVKCAECHIGEGADWYVRSKLSGVRQVYHAIKGDYSRPIPTPVHNLRPAEETCERCHWPEKFYSASVKNKTYYPTYDSEYSEWILQMLVHVGSNQNKNEGIHAHMYLDHDIYFAAEDERLQEITWVKSVDQDGKSEIYTTEDSQWKETEPPEEKIHKMDCMDCHNRPTHNFNPPNKLVNQALYNGMIDSQLPSIKSKAMELMSGDYSTEEEAVAAIRSGLEEYYKEEFTDDYPQYETAVSQAADSIITLFKNNIFPEMKTRWDVFPDNIGHLTSPGCFRCHDEEHISESGNTITKDCSVCHTITAQGPGDNVTTNVNGLEFVHPFEDDGLWQDMNCTDCHTGN